MNYREEYIEYLKARGRARQTIKLHTWGVACFDNYLRGCARQDITEVSRADAEAYIKMMTTHYVSPRSRRKPHLRTVWGLIGVAVLYMRYAARKGHILISPFEHIERPRHPRHIPRNILNEEEAQRLLTRPDTTTAIGVRDRAILELLYSSGMRMQELINLNVYDVDFTNKTVKVCKGKCGKDRMLPLGKTAEYYVRKYIIDVRNKYLHPLKRHKEIPDLREASLFLGQLGKRLKRSGIHILVRRYSRDLFPGRGISSHSLRHSCATHMLRSGANIRVIQELLGHSAISSTQIYTRVCPIDLKAAHKKYHPRSKV